MGYGHSIPTWRSPCKISRWRIYGRSGREPRSTPVSPSSLTGLHEPSEASPPREDRTRPAYALGRNAWTRVSVSSARVPANSARYWLRQGRSYRTRAASPCARTTVMFVSKYSVASPRRSARDFVLPLHLLGDPLAGVGELLDSARRPQRLRTRLHYRRIICRRGW